MVLIFVWYWFVFCECIISHVLITGRKYVHTEVQCPQNLIFTYYIVVNSKTPHNFNHSKITTHGIIGLCYMYHSLTGTWRSAVEVLCAYQWHWLCSLCYNHRCLFWLQFCVDNGWHSWCYGRHLLHLLHCLPWCVAVLSFTRLSSDAVEHTKTTEEKV